jgi:hypothetical protein
MIKTPRTVCRLPSLVLACSLAAVTPRVVFPADTTVMVTPDNYSRAETDRQFSVTVGEAGIGKLHHTRNLMPVDHQTVVRGNRDTLYSAGVLDLDAGPVTITMPDAGTRFMSLMVIDEDHYVSSVAYGPGVHTLSRQPDGTRYVLAGIRTLVNPNNPQDFEVVHRLQDAIKVEQASSGAFVVPAWDSSSREKVGAALLQLAATIPDTRRMFGARDQVDAVRHLVGAATGWGGNPEKDAMYLTVVPPRNDGRTVHRLVVKDVPVDGFWSISVYNAKGYYEPNPYTAYTINNLTGKIGSDGTMTVQFGGCDGKLLNCLPITPGWNYWVRLYRPRASILDGTWKFPEAQPVSSTAPAGAHVAYLLSR